MRTLNLVDLAKSDIKYKISKFPDGQQNIVITENKLNPFRHRYASKEDIIRALSTIQIKSRLNNFQDLELIICTTASLRELGTKEIHLYVPYIVGARSDRKFEEGGNNYLKDVICPIINSLNLDSVTCLDPHSDCLEMGIKNFKKESNLELIKWSLDDHSISRQGPLENSAILISPDAGASKKIYKIAEQIGYKGDIITCSKERDNEGKLTKTNVPTNCISEDVIIIDDICDGGATFINIAKEVKPKMDDDCKIYLIVTHGIFSKGVEELLKYFDGIYCTNSYSNIKYETDQFNNIRPEFMKEIKQLNVF